MKIFSPISKISDQDKIQEFRNLVDAELDKYFNEKLSQAKKNLPQSSQELIQQVAEFTLRGGKRIRAALLYFSYLGYGGKNKKAALSASMAMELSESFMLIHDDIMDQDDLRRKGKTVNIYYRDKSPDNCDPTHFGISMALVAGDMAFAMSNEIMAKSEFASERIVKAMMMLNTIYIAAGHGQALDMLSSSNNALTMQDILLINELKTTSYTFNAPIKIGAILAGASDNTLIKLESYTMPIGIAFQIKDDILGLMGTEEKIGKKIASDIKEGKKTSLIIYALQNANTEQKDRILHNLGNPNFDIDEIRLLIKETGSLEYCNNLCKELAESAKNALNYCNLRKETRDIFKYLADYIVAREY